MSADSSSLQKASDEEINARVSEVVFGIGVLSDAEMRAAWEREGGDSGTIRGLGWYRFEHVEGESRFVCDEPRRFCSDESAAASVRAEIAKRRLGDAYTYALRDVVFGVKSYGDPAEEQYWFRNVFEMLCASPRQQMLAALAVLESASPSLGIPEKKE